MTRALVILLLAGPPGLHRVPSWPYARLIRHEPIIVRWLIDHRGTPTPTADIIADPDVPVKLRQKVYQFQRKWRTP
ncbi:MAG: hypothetical protein QM570_15425 [Planctomycetota bacterium]|jgi:hypothetical protein|nr:hypothetical protein [Planctomycetota bacterium]